MDRYKIAVLIFYTSLFGYSQADDGLVAKFTFNNSADFDEIASIKVKLYGGKYTEDRFGNSKYAYYIPGNYTDYINLGTDKILKSPKGTISLWVNIQQAVYSGYGAEHNPIIFTRSHGGDDCNEAFFVGYHFLLRKFDTGTSLSEEKQVVIYPEATAYLRTWYHLVVTYDDRYLTFYINGEPQGKAIKNFESKFLEGDSVVVGNRTSRRNNRYFQGKVDDIYFFNRVLSQAEILLLYNAPNPNLLGILKKWLLILLAIAGFVLLIIYIIKTRIKKILAEEHLKNELKNRWYEQENKVLSAQMDPHFIFNSLNTIQQFIITNDNERAQIYLSKFSRLMRKIIESNRNETIKLKEEIDIFEKYIEIEALRFNNIFSYEVILSPAIDAEKLMIPHFLIQPIIENAIWHGLLPKDGDKQLKIYFELVNEKVLSCKVVDNGVGRAARKSNNKAEAKESFAINFIGQRLALLSKLNSVDCGILITDNYDNKKQSTGTTVMLAIPIYTH